MSEHRCLGCEDWQRRDAWNRADNARLLEAISEFVEAFDRDPIKYADLMDRTREAVDGLYEIAREGE